MEMELRTPADLQTSDQSGPQGDSEDAPVETGTRALILKISVILIFLLLLLTAVVTTVLALGNCKSVTDPAPCLDPWIGYLQKCFYFSENTTTWERSQKFCASHEATLVMVTTTQELDFLRRYSDSSQYWIGLSRQPGQVWRWVDGKLSTNWIKVIGVGEYAYLHRNGVGSASSHLRRKWICSRPASTTPRN